MTNVINSIQSRIWLALLKVESFGKRYVFTPLKEFYVTLSKRRENNLRLFLYINFAVYYMYITTISYNSEKYLYMVKVRHK